MVQFSYNTIVLAVPCPQSFRQNVDSVLYDQPHPVQLPLVLCPGGQEIDAGGLNAAVAQHVGQTHDVPVHPVKGRGEQVAEVVRENLAGRDPRRPAQPLHLRPDLASVQGPPASGRERSRRRRFFAVWRISAACGTAYPAEGWCDLALAEISAFPALAPPR